MGIPVINDSFRLAKKFMNVLKENVSNFLGIVGI